MSPEIREATAEKPSDCCQSGNPAEVFSEVLVHHIHLTPSASLGAMAARNLENICRPGRRFRARDVGGLWAIKNRWVLLHSSGLPKSAAGTTNVRHNILPKAFILSQIPKNLAFRK